MAYETEKARLLQMLTSSTGISRKVNTDLAREADERAIEAYQEVGIGPQPDGSYKGISHPTQMERESRLGPEWAGKGVAEIAIWCYYTYDAVKFAAEGFMNSAPHRNVLVDTRFKHWAVGVYTHLPVGEPEHMRRWYFIVWLSVDVPTPPPPPVPEPTPQGDCPANLTPINNRKTTIFDGVNVRLRPKLGSEGIDYITTSNKVANVIGFVPGDDYLGTTKWYVFWEGSKGWRYVNSRSNLCTPLTRIE